MTGEMTSGQVTAGGVVAPNRRDFATLENALHGWLLSKLPQSSGLQTTGFAYPKGAGLSHETILFDATWTEQGVAQTKGLVIRIKPTSNQVFLHDWFVDQYEVMATLSRAGKTPIATPLWLELDETIVGAAFFVMEKVIGKVPVSFPPYSREGWVKDLDPAQRRRLWESAIHAFASIQTTPIANVAFLDPDGRHPEGVGQEWDRWREYYDWARDGETYPVLDEAWASLERTRPPVHQPGLVWGDARIGNIMFDEHQNVVAVMDWEAPGIGGALHDLAYWCVMARVETEQQGVARLEGMGSREETIALWGQLTGIDTSDIEWYERFAALKLCLLAVRMLGRSTPERPGMNRFDNPASRVMAILNGFPAPATEMPQPRPAASTH